MSRAYRNRDASLLQLGERVLELDPNFGQERPGQALVDAAVELDVLANRHLLGGSRETISARIGRRVFLGTATQAEQALCSALELLEPQHCLKSYLRTLDQPRPRRPRRRKPDDDWEDC